MQTSGDEGTSAADAYRLGMRLYRDGRFEEASKTLSSFKSDGGLLGKLSRFYRALADRSAGLEAMRRGELTKAQGHLKSAGAIAGHSNLSSYLAESFARSGKVEQCLHHADRAVEEADGIDTRRKLALAQWQSGRRAQAYLTLGEAIRQMRDDGRLSLQMGSFHAAEGQNAQACEWFLKASTLRGEDPKVHCSLGLVSAVTGDVAGSARYFQRAWELAPSDLSIAYRLAMAAKACAQRGVKFTIRIPEQAANTQAPSQFSQLARFVTAEPEFLEAFLALPPSDADSELFEMLAGVVQMALAEHPGYADLHLHASRIAQRLGDLRAASKHAAEAIKINPKFIQALLHAGKLYGQQGDAQRAVSHLERAVTLGADWPDVHCLAGELSLSCGMRGRGEGHLRRALHLNANYPRAKASLSAMAA